ncbi:MAG: hypothetical protein LBN02_05325 [Oscillospiraceae bacterium]|jgi:hypothetical protein|nr:hypothetical protein [Oscillospiraceae bacterium]
MKKFLTAALALTLTFTLAACTVPNEPSTTSPTPTLTPTIGAYLPDIPREFPDEPYTLGEIGTQYYGAPQYEFTPSADYGAIVPYIGGVVSKTIVHSPTYSTELRAMMLGFATSDGKIICEPVFSDCLLYTDGDTAVYVARRSRFVGGKNVREDWLIPASGAWAERYDTINAGNPDIAIARGYIAVERGGNWGVIDYSGGIVIPLISCALPHIYTDNERYIFLISDISNNAVDITDAHGVLKRASTYVAQYWVDENGTRVTDTEYVDFSGDMSRQPFIEPDGYYRIGYHSGEDGYPQGYPLEVFPSFQDISGALYGEITLQIGGSSYIIDAAGKSSETRLPDGTVIVRRSLLGAQFE